MCLRGGRGGGKAEAGNVCRKPHLNISHNNDDIDNNKKMCSVLYVV
jgi:hypothetical protein